MIELLYILATTFFIALLAFVGVFALSLKEKLLNKILLVLVSLSAGAIMGGGFIYISATDLVPEIKKELDFKKYTATLIVFILGIFIMWFVKNIFHG
jgi:zinc transporter ZupT